MDGLVDMTSRLPSRQSLLLLLAFLLHLCLQSPCSTTTHGLPQTSNELERNIYIVYLGEKQHQDVDLVTESHHEMLASILESKEEALESIVYSYKYGFSGFAARLTKSQASKIRGLPGVVSVRENQIHRAQTTRSWDFLGMDYKQPNGLLAKAGYGDGIIIGVLDSGITPESESFSGTGYGPPPSKWKGICQVGPSFGAKSCNQKLIGARIYADGIPEDILETDILSPRDIYGHGTHTASTAGGNIVHNVSFAGMAAGTVRGGAPHARIAVYKVCWGEGISCADADIVKGLDDAIHDGVDVLSLSIAGPRENPGTLHVVANGIPIIYGAGNAGPIAQTVENQSPWLITVAATTMDRSFPVSVTLGNKDNLIAQPWFPEGAGANQFHEIQYIDNCDVSNVDETMKGKIAFCTTQTFNPAPYFADITEAVAKHGGSGVILPQFNADNLLSEDLIKLKIPWVPVDYEMANKIYNYYYEDDNPTAKISLTQTTVGSEVSAPRVAAFSSRGPSPIYPGVIKPDIAAPGVKILAAAPKNPNVLYRFDSGTSMATPHISGIVAVLKSLHPEWSPAALKSAIMTTALTVDNNWMPIQADGNVQKIADAFDYGAGFVNPTRAADPGLIYDISASEYLRFFNCMGGLGAGGNCTTAKGSVANLNLPSIAIPDLRTFETVARTVTNVGQPNAVYKAFLQPPAGVKMAVEPPVLVFSKVKRMQSFKVTFKATRKVQGDYMFGSLAWHDGGSHWVRIPIAVRIVIEEFYSKVA